VILGQLVQAPGTSFFLGCRPSAPAIRAAKKKSEMFHAIFGGRFTLLHGVHRGRNEIVAIVRRGAGGHNKDNRPRIHLYCSMPSSPDSDEATLRVLPMPLEFVWQFLGEQLKAEFPGCGSQRSIQRGQRSTSAQSQFKIGRIIDRERMLSRQCQYVRPGTVVGFPEPRQVRARSRHRWLLWHGEIRADQALLP
jgi:hypothetical protein